MLRSGLGGLPRVRARGGYLGGWGGWRKSSGDAPRPAEQALHAALQRADLERAPVVKARQLLSAVHGFLYQAENTEITRNQATLESRLVEAATAEPDAALRQLAAVAVRCHLDQRAVTAVLRAWMRRPDAESFAASWSAAEELLAAGPSSLYGWLTEGVRAQDPDVSPEFRGLAASHLTGLVDAQFEHYQFSGPASPVWQMMYALGPAGRADWFCVLGDRAEQRGDEAEATRRYELADRFGGTQAKQRLARMRDVSAYRLLQRGDLNEARLKGTGSPNPYRHLLLAAAAIIGGRPVGAYLNAAAHGPIDPHIAASVTFLTALTRLREGDQQSARKKLQQLLDTPTTSATDADLVANAQLLLGALDGDDRLVAAGARALIDRHREQWLSRSIVDPMISLTAASQGDPALLPELAVVIRQQPSTVETGSALETLCVGAARGVLANAARAALAHRLDEATALLTQAAQLLGPASGPAADQLRRTSERIAEIIARLSSTPTTARALDQLAFAALRTDDGIQPWTATATRLWEECDTAPDTDPMTLHHLAIAQHAKAYQLELADDDQARDQWSIALRTWSRLHDDDRFWDLLRARLATTMPDTGTAETDLAVDAARADLPAHLLDVHVTRVQQLRKERPARALAHMGLIRSAPFSREAVAAARAKLAREAGTQVRRLSREGEAGRALDEAQAWMQIDQDNIQLAETALDVGIEFAEDASRGDEWAEVVRPVLERVGTLVEPMREALGLTADQTIRMSKPLGEPEGDRTVFAGKLARHEFWLGTCLLLAGVARVRADPYAQPPQFWHAATHLRQAVMLGLPAVSPYNQGRELLNNAQQSERAVRGSRMGFY